MKTILVVLLVLLAAVVKSSFTTDDLWAGEPGYTTADCKLYYDASGSLHSTCEDDGVWSYPVEPGTLLYIEPKERACHKKMQEAMNEMDRMQAITLREWRENQELREKVGKPGMKLWEDTMRDCVTER